MAATKRNAMLHEEARQKIRTTQLINRLQDHALGSVEMTATQVQATRILLGKCLPDMTEAKVTVHSGDARQMSDAELLDVIAGRSGARASSEASSEDGADTLH
jgi:hypothetical protein